MEGLKFTFGYFFPLCINSVFWRSFKKKKPLIPPHPHQLGSTQTLFKNVQFFLKKILKTGEREK